eukprot:SRR837773.10500.p2 GENE.SRR837773.10500~~SRR837773.10500.p2  ORF type:complete len:524 (-),score=260.69 SRR837773.10500:116-1687(-)
MTGFRTAGFIAFALAADAARINHKAADSLTSLVDMKSGVWLTSDCQDYPEELQEMGFGLGDTVRIYKPGARGHNVVGLVGCQDDTSPGKICLEDLKGCYDKDELRSTSTLALTFNLIADASQQIFKAIKDDVKDAWEDVQISFANFGGAVGDFINQQREDLTDMIKDKCDPTPALETEKHLNATLVQTKSRLAMLIDSAASRWGNVKEGIKDVAKTTKAKLAKLALDLQAKLGHIYDDHLKVKVEALQTYLGGIVDAVTNVPDELNPLAGGEADAVQAEPSGLSKAIEQFTDGVGELSAKIMEVAKDSYERFVAALGTLQAGAGRLIAWCSEKWSVIKAAVVRMAGEAQRKVQEWNAKALDFVCNFDAKETVKSILKAVQDKFDKAVDAVKRGVSAIKQGLKDTADSLTGMVTTAAITIKTTSKTMWESDTVQNALATLREEIRVLKELIVEQSKLVQKFLGGFMSYFGRFIPSWVKNKLKTAAEKARELAVQIQEKVRALMLQATAGETDTIEVDDDVAADM